MAACLTYARKLRAAFLKTPARLKVIVHPGGMSMDEEIADKDALMKNLIGSMKRLVADDIELLAENMPPYPWYYGGQYLHNFFMSASDTASFAAETGWKTCFDISHAALYCNKTGESLTAYTKAALPHAAHLHVADAAGVDGEGLQIGEGTVNFREILPLLIKTGLPMVAEIWQGHRYGGEGFWKAMVKLHEIAGAKA
jgi:sugar phosphate isomerase/epimerase